MYEIDFSKFTLIENKYLAEEFLEDQKFVTLSDFQFEFDSIQMVDSLENLEQAKQSIYKSDIVGVDCEFKKNFIPMQKPKVSLIQIATRDQCFIVDVEHLKEHSQLKEFCRELFENDSIKKIGFDFKNDLKTLIQTIGVDKMIIRTLFDLFDIQQKIHGEVMTLANLIAKYFGKELDKFEQCSDWSTRPLRKSQLVYSAKDAVCLVRAFDIIKNHDEFIEEFEMDNDIITCD